MSWLPAREFTPLCPYYVCRHSEMKLKSTLTTNRFNPQIINSLMQSWRIRLSYPGCNFPFFSTLFRDVGNWSLNRWCSPLDRWPPNRGSTVIAKEQPSRDKRKLTSAGKRNQQFAPWSPLPSEQPWVHWQHEIQTWFGWLIWKYTPVR